MSNALIDPRLERQVLRSLIGDRTPTRRVRSADVVRCQVPVACFAAAHHAALYETVLAEAGRSRFVVDEEIIHRLEKTGAMASVGGPRGLDEILSEAWQPPSETQARRLAHLWRLRGVRDGAMAILRATEEADLGEASTAYLELGRTMDSAAVSDDHGETTLGKAFATMLEDFKSGKVGIRIEDPRMRPIRDALFEALAGAMIVVGGSTGSGKSSLCLKLTHEMRRERLRPGVVSLEDPAKVWGDRVGAMYSGVSLLSLQRNGKTLTHDGADAINLAVDTIRADDTPLVTLDDHSLETVLAKMRRLVTVHGCDVLIVDYLQLVTRDDMPRETHARRMGRTGQDLKNQAKRLGVPLILCSQLKRPDKGKAEPTIFDLKETGDLENMAEAVVLLWKESDQSDAETRGKVAKLKNGPTRPRFEVERGSGGQVVGLRPADAPLENGAPRGGYDFGQFKD